MNPIPHISTDAAARLDKHLQQKNTNQKWLVPCLDGQTSTFLCQLSAAENAQGTIASMSLCYPSQQNQQQPPRDRRSAVHFVVNIPEGLSPSNSFTNS